MTPIDSSITVALSPWEPGGFALAVFFILVAGLLAVILALTQLVNPSRTSPEKDRPYECGVIPTAEPSFRYPAPFSLVAMVFLIFDVETAFIYTWAVSFDVMSAASFIGISVFIGVLLLSLWYLWLKGGLQWGSATRP
ncbi:MAG: NADH-quinone oxidoreductase subunit A [Acidobacteriota bacterium]